METLVMPELMDEKVMEVKENPPNDDGSRRQAKKEFKQVFCL